MFLETTLRDEPEESGNYRPPLDLIRGALRSMDFFPFFIPEPLVIPLVN